MERVEGMTVLLANDKPSIKVVDHAVTRKRDLRWTNELS